MAETKFIKAAVIGGYDKEDVDKRLEFLYNMIYDLKNELRESKLLLQNYQSGKDAEKSFEAVLANERAHITQIQVKNETLSEKNKSLKEEIKAKEAENVELREKVKTLQTKLADAELIAKSSEPEALGVMFVEVQKSRDTILNDAQKKAKELEEKSKNFAENFIIDANNQASKTIYTAEKQAAEIIANAKNQAEQLKASSNNIKAIMHSQILELNETSVELRKIMIDLTDKNLSSLKNAIDILDDAEKKLSEGGVPVFTPPQEIKPEYPPEPVYQKPKAPEKKHNDQLDKLQAMAESIGSDKEKKSDKKSVNLDDLVKQADSIGSDKTPEKPPKKESKDIKKKDSGMSLADLMNQANSLDNK